MWDTAWIFATPSASDNPWPYKHRFFTFTFSDVDSSVADEISIDGVKRPIPKSSTFSYLYYYNDTDGNIYELEVDKNDKKYQ